MAAARSTVFLHNACLQGTGFCLLQTERRAVEGIKTGLIWTSVP